MRDTHQTYMKLRADAGVIGNFSMTISGVSFSIGSSTRLAAQSDSCRPCFSGATNHTPTRPFAVSVGQTDQRLWCHSHRRLIGSISFQVKAVGCAVVSLARCVASVSVTKLHSCTSAVHQYLAGVVADDLSALGWPAQISVERYVLDSPRYFPHVFSTISSSSVPALCRRSCRRHDSFVAHNRCSATMLSTACLVDFGLGFNSF